MRYKFLNLFLLFSLLIFLINCQADISTVSSKEKLLKQGFTTELNRNGFNKNISPLTLEMWLMWEKGYNFQYIHEYKWIDDDILYRIFFLSEIHPNICVFAYLLEDDSYENLKKSGSLITSI